MPSTTSRVVSIPLASSTVTTPSLPTFSIASAMRLPTVASLLAAMVATCAISFLSLVDFDIFWSSRTTFSTARSMPRCSAVGFAPAVTFLRPARKMAWARTVAVVVPSPAISEVLEATSFSIWAPMFSKWSFSSISLATVTPSFVMVGLPNFLSMTTLRPLGPSVTLTAWDRTLTPRRRAARASSLNWSCFDMDLFLRRMWTARELRLRMSGSDDAEDVLLLHDEEVLAVERDVVAGVLSEEHAISRLDVERDLLAVLRYPSLADRDDLALLRLLLGAVRNDDGPPPSRFVLDPLDEHPVVQGV